MRIGLGLIAGMLFAQDALAWGLQTHVFLAQWALAAAPLADPQIRAAALRLPRLCAQLLRQKRGFDASLQEARGMVRQMDAVLRGLEPRLQPEPDQAMRKEALAMRAPSAPPTITSLG